MTLKTSSNMVTFLLSESEIFFLAEGKSGTLFDFESDQDVTKIETTNVMAKSTVKVCTRTWYEGMSERIFLKYSLLPRK